MFAEIKAYAIGACAVVIIASLVWFGIHERNEGIAKERVVLVKLEAETKKVADAAIQHNADVQALAQEKSNHIGEVYEKAVAIPAVGDPGLVCSRPTPARSGQVSGASDYRPENPGAPHDPGTDTFNPSLGLDAIGIAADAQINALIDQVQALVDEMSGKTK